MMNIRFPVAILVTVIVYVFLHVMFNGHAGFQVQAAWTLAGVFGTFVTAYNLVDALQDKRALKEAKRNGDLAYMAQVSVNVEALRLSKMLVIVIIGVCALSATPVLTSEQREALHIPVWTFMSILITGGLLYIVGGTIAQALLDRLVRNRFYSRSQRDVPSAAEFMVTINLLEDQVRRLESARTGGKEE